MFLNLLEAVKCQVVFHSRDAQRKSLPGSGYRTSYERDPGLLHDQSYLDAF